METKIYKDFRYKPAMFMGLTMRQLFFCLLAIGAAVGVYFLLHDSLGDEAVSWVCVFAAFPFAVAGFFERDGMTLEVLFVAFFHWLRTCRRRTYHSENYYRTLLDAAEKAGDDADVLVQ